MFEEQDMPERMAAAVLQGPGRIAVEQVPVPTMGPADVLVEVGLCGICGTDLHTVLEGWGARGSWQGHEWTGRLVALGSAVEGWNVGDEVVGGPIARCGECAACQAGRPSLCDARTTPGLEVERGAFATYKVHPAAELLRLPHGLDPRAAALAEPLAVALHGIHQARLQAGQSALVMGAGPIGALSIAVLRDMGVDPVLCVEPGQRRRELAGRVGATRVLDPSDLVVPSMAEPGLVVTGAVDAVLECSGKAAAMEAGLAQLVRGGVLVLIGSGIDPPRFDPNRILLNEVVITGAFTYDQGGFEEALALLASGRLPIDDLVEPDLVGLDGVLEAMQGLADGRLAGKVLVQP